MSDLDPRLEAALRKMFFPFARVMLRHGLDVKPIIRILKAGFVDAAISEHGKNGKPASISRASELIGLTRKEIREIVNEELQKKLVHTKFSGDEATLLAYWNSDPRFASSDGQPKVLEIGPGPGTFADLVEQSIGNISLDDTIRRLQESECASVDSDGRITLLKRDWNVSEDLPRLLRDTFGTLATTVDYNDARTDEFGLCQRISFTVRADPKKVVVTKRMLRNRIIRFIEEVDDQITGIEVHDNSAEDDLSNPDLGKLGVAAYLFEIEAD